MGVFEAESGFQQAEIEAAEGGERFLPHSHGPFGGDDDAGNPAVAKDGAKLRWQSGGAGVVGGGRVDEAEFGEARQARAGFDVAEDDFALGRERAEDIVRVGLVEDDPARVEPTAREEQAARGARRGVVGVHQGEHCVDVACVERFIGTTKDLLLAARQG